MRTDGNSGRTVILLRGPRTVVTKPKKNRRRDSDSGAVFARGLSLCFNLSWAWAHFLSSTGPSSGME